MKIIYYCMACFVIVFFLNSCSNNNVANIKNTKAGTLNATMKLKPSKEKRFMLDGDTAPTPQYIQMFKDSAGVDYFTFLNTYTNSIYFYDYDSLEYIKKITYDKQGPDGILKAMGYHIKNMDSIYVYDIAAIDIKITNDKSRVLNKISLNERGASKMWYLKYPQYIPKTVTPFLESDNKIFFTGQIMRTVPEDLIDIFKFTAQIDLKTDQVNFIGTYPRELYGQNYNWEGEIFTEVFTELHPEGNKLIYSFPVSHNLYVYDLESGTSKKVYAGSNFVSSISSIGKNPKKVSREELIQQVIKQDEYSAILYDKYRKVYYRFLLKGIPNANTHTHFKEKPIGIIIMDKDFNYLGETTLGPWNVWNWQNSFVTKEGLNIEYLDKDDIDEVALTLKIFTLENL